jgi:hypothetical protein
VTGYFRQVVLERTPAADYEPRPVGVTVHYEQIVKAGVGGDGASTAGAAAAVRAAGVGLGNMDMGEVDSGHPHSDVAPEPDSSSAAEVEADSESSSLPPLVWEMLLARIPPTDVCRLVGSVTALPCHLKCLVDYEQTVRESVAKRGGGGVECVRVAKRGGGGVECARVHW